MKPSVASLSRTRDNQRGDAVGSGIYLKLLNRPYWLTCEHVLGKGYAPVYRLTHLPKSDDFYQAFPHVWFVEPWPVDLGVIYIDPQVWKKGDREGVPLGRIAERYDPVEHELLFICGHPAAEASFRDIPGEDRQLKSNRISYLAREAPLPAGIDPASHFALQYEMNLAKATDPSRKRKLPPPPGFSGSAIWDCGFVRSGCAEKWDPSEARLVGVAQRWLEDESCLIAIKAEAIRSFLLANVRKDFAYHRWVGRGSPDGGITNDGVAYGDAAVSDLS